MSMILSIVHHHLREAERYYSYFMVKDYKRATKFIPHSRQDSQITDSYRSCDLYGHHDHDLVSVDSSSHVFRQQ